MNQFADDELDLEDGQVVARRLISQEDKSKKVDISMIEILKLNRPEWHLILIGSIAATVSGVIQPAFAILMSEIVGVCSSCFQTANQLFKSYKLISEK